MTVQRYELQLISASISTNIDTINATLATISGSGEPFPYTGSAEIIGSLTVTGSIYSNELAFLTATTAVSASYAVTASYALNGGGGGESLERRHSFESPYDYCGIAPLNTSESDPNWTITRLTVALNGSVTKGTAVGAWENRNSLIYNTSLIT
jgi:hypothetical protein